MYSCSLHHSHISYTLLRAFLHTTLFALMARNANTSSSRSDVRANSESNTHSFKDGRLQPKTILINFKHLGLIECTAGTLWQNSALSTPFKPITVG